MHNDIKLTCNIQEIAGNHVILDKAAHKMIEEFLRSNSVGKPLVENAAIYKQHSSEEKMPVEIKSKQK